MTHHLTLRESPPLVKTDSDSDSQSQSQSQSQETFLFDSQCLFDPNKKSFRTCIDNLGLKFIQDMNCFKSASLRPKKMIKHQNLIAFSNEKDIYFVFLIAISAI